MELSVVSLAALGAAHGLNPAMGWLFAVAIGLQERSRAALLESLLPIAIGHEAAVVLALVLIEATGAAAGQRIVGIAGAIALIAFGAYKLFARARAPALGGHAAEQPRARRLVVPHVQRARRRADAAAGRRGGPRRRRPDRSRGSSAIGVEAGARGSCTRSRCS